MEPNEDPEDPQRGLFATTHCDGRAWGVGRAGYLDEGAGPDDWQRHHGQIDQDTHAMWFSAAYIREGEPNQ